MYIITSDVVESFISRLRRGETFQKSASRRDSCLEDYITDCCSHASTHNENNKCFIAFILYNRTISHEITRYDELTQPTVIGLVLSEKTEINGSLNRLFCDG